MHGQKNIKLWTFFILQMELEEINPDLLCPLERADLCQRNRWRNRPKTKEGVRQLSSSPLYSILRTLQSSIQSVTSFTF